MKVKHKDIHVRISRRILWVGPQAYPLSQVVRVYPQELRLRRTAAVKDFGRRAGATIGLAVVGLIATSCVGRTLPAGIWVAFWLVVAGLLALHTAQLIRLLRLPKLYVLRVAMAGSEQAAVVSTDEDIISDLITQVADAIDNPAAEFEVHVDNIIFGDKVEGDQVLGDKTIFAGAK
jgi:hypothetical protein